LPVGAALESGRLSASPECEQLCAWVGGYGLSIPELLRFHQLIVDAYGAQHPGPPTGAIRVAYGLVGLHLALDRGLSGTSVREAHQLMGKPRSNWPVFARLPVPATLTIADVARRGFEADDPAGHATAVFDWAKAVWASWRSRRNDVAALTESLFTGSETFWRDRDNYRLR
jgi:hypothetical protein